MIDLFCWPTPNGDKIAIFLEESGLEYQFIRIDIFKNEQFSPEFLRISPNNKIPAIVDHNPVDKGQPANVFESGAILIYVAEKTDTFSSARMAILASGRIGANVWSEPSLFIYEWESQ